MSKFEQHTSRVIPLLIDNIDTDQIIPARFLKVTDKVGLGKQLFADWRYHEDGSPKKEFPLNQENHQNVQFLLVGDNFGCGSSREHAPWALSDYGLRAVISTSFADIFKNNSLKNGLLPVAIDAASHQKMVQLVRENPEAEITIDLTDQILIFPDESTATFSIAPFSRTCLLKGIDELGYIMEFEKQIAEYEARYG
jgi:3-isopropylmalate/(R)-2-methylmalate dehydratase small subunit